MIKFYEGGYDRVQLEKLKDVIYEACESVYVCATELDCKKCKHYQLCKDLDRLYAYLSDLLQMQLDFHPETC